jgi:hypothetical protein
MTFKGVVICTQSERVEKYFQYYFLYSIGLSIFFSECDVHSFAIQLVLTLYMFISIAQGIDI